MNLSDFIKDVLHCDQRKICDGCPAYLKVETIGGDFEMCYLPMFENVLIEEEN